MWIVMMHDKETGRTFEEAYYDNQRAAIRCAKRYAREDAEIPGNNELEYWVKCTDDEEEVAPAFDEFIIAA